MNDIPKASQIVIGVASVVLLGALAYLFVRWLGRADRPWAAVVGLSRVALPVLQIYGTWLMATGALSFLLVFPLGRLFGGELQRTDYLLGIAWKQFAGGVAVFAVAAAGRRLRVPPTADRGSVWLVDMGMGKVRPCLILSVPADPPGRARVTVVPHTTRARDARFEADVPTPFPGPGVFDARQIATVTRARLVKQIGSLGAAELSQVEEAVRRWLGW